jgi:hypothetical protein
MFCLQSPLYIAFKVPRKGAPLQVPLSQPHRNRRPVPKPSSTYLSKSLVKEPPLQVPHRGPYTERCSSPGPREECSISKARLYSSLKGPGRSPLPGSPTGPPWKEMPIPRAFIHSFIHGESNMVTTVKPHTGGRPTYGDILKWPTDSRQDKKDTDPVVNLTMITEIGNTSTNTLLFILLHF